MGELNPGRLALMLQDLRQELQYWRIYAGDAIQETNRRQIKVADRVTEATFRTAMMQSLVADDQEQVEQLQRDTSSARNKMQQAVQDAGQLVQVVTVLYQKALTTQQQWEQQLQHALVWLKQAQEWVARAEAELARAKNALSQAQWELSRAESALRSCQNWRDEKGNRRNCNGEIRAVNAAQVAVANARRWVAVAEADLLAAREEERRAQARVNCCSNALVQAQSAVEIAEEATNVSQLALSQAERSVESIQASLIFAAKSQTAYEKETTQLSELTYLVASLRDKIAEAQISHRAAERLEESAQRLQHLVTLELENRIDHLMELNRPTLDQSR